MILTKMMIMIVIARVIINEDDEEEKGALCFMLTYGNLNICISTCNTFDLNPYYIFYTSRSMNYLK